MFSLGLCLFQAQLFSCQCLLFTNEEKKCITANQMGTFHMTKPINHLGGTQVWHSRAATHHFTVYQAQTHGHQSMAPWGPMRRGASPQPHWFMADDFIITHPFSRRRNELPNNVSHHVNTNTANGAALVGKLTCSLASHIHMWACCYCWNKSTFNKQKKCPLVPGYWNQVSV